MNNGTMTPKVPSMGAWMSYGLGTENANLPAYIVLCPGRPVRFSILWNSAFLPSQHQGVYINHSKITPKEMIPWLRNAKLDPTTQRKQLDLMQAIAPTSLYEIPRNRPLRGFVVVRHQLSGWTIVGINQARYESTIHAKSNDQY